MDPWCGISQEKYVVRNKSGVKQMATSSVEKQIAVDWKPIAPSGPNAAFHVGCIINNCLYIHGGITSKASTVPSDKLFRLDLSSLLWSEIFAPGSPALSHHACVALNNQYILLVGGWDGKVRGVNLHVYDTKKNEWTHPLVTGFPGGGGLSSHTATLLAGGDVFIMGREGSVRFQKRFGSAFILSGSVEKGLFKYTEYSDVTSRSGHTANILNSNLYVIGGRDDKLIERYPRFSSGSHKSISVVSKLNKLVPLFKPLSKPPCGRRHHVTIAGSDTLLIHGGETFDGRCREPVGEVYVIVTKPHTVWYKVDVRSVGRAGHVCCTDGEEVIIHGGLSGKSAVNGDTYQLLVP